MKKHMKKIIKKIAPSLASEIERIHSIDERLDVVISEILKYSKHDSRLDILRELLSKVEHYQPTYGLTGLIDTPARASLDRCNSIYQYLDGNVNGMRFLDIGSSLGYICFFFADHGAKAEGWEMSVDNAEASRLIGGLNGIPIDIKTKLLDDQTIHTINTSQYDVITLLSVIHHIIHFKGLEYTQKLVADLVRKIPIMFVELAKKGEDKNLFWDASQPENELAIFDLVKDEITIKKISEFNNHLSANSRPLYVIEYKKTVSVNKKKYIYKKKSSQAYDFSEAALNKEKRRYYWTDRMLIKEYIFEEGMVSDNAMLIINEIAYLLKTKDIPALPKMIDYEISDSGAKIALELIGGNIISTRKSHSVTELRPIYRDLLDAIKGLHKRGIYHNDIRTWNVIYDGKRASLIDLGQASGVDEDNDLIALMWVMSSLFMGVRESTQMAKTSLPDIKDLPDFLIDDYKKIKSGVSQAHRLDNER